MIESVPLLKEAWIRSLAAPTKVLEQGHNLHLPLDHISISLHELNSILVQHGLTYEGFIVLSHVLIGSQQSSSLLTVLLSPGSILLCCSVLVHRLNLA